MVVSTPDKGSLTPGDAEVRTADQRADPHTGPFSRLLAKVSKWSSEYAEYRLSQCDWRKISV